MSDDPETARQIAELAHDTRPLLVLDVDEVLLEFIGPLCAFLNTVGFELKMDSFRLHGNIVAQDSGIAADKEAVTSLIDDFFHAQEKWQTPVEMAVETVAELAGTLEIVLLTAAPHRFRDRRRGLLDRIGFPYPLVTTEAAKGPAIAKIRGETGRPVAFVDDIPHNLVSVQNHVPDAALIHLMAHAKMRALLPPLGEPIRKADGWVHAGDMIRSHFSI